MEQKTRQILDEAPMGLFKAGQEVEIFISARTDLGFKVVVAGQFWALVYANEVFMDLPLGQTRTAYIRRQREDGKLDVSLYPQGLEGREELAAQIIEALRGAGGMLPIDDKSEADLIYRMFGVSKKKFKIALGFLYKQRRVLVQEGRTSLVANPKS